DASGRDILIKATVPLESLSLLPAGDSWLEGRVVVRGDVSLKGDPVCEFEHELPLRVARSAGGATRLIFETGCVLKPGSYELALAVLDPATGDIGARRSPLVVPAAVGGGLPFVSDIHLWTREAGAVLISAGADRIGLKDGATTGGFVPRAERRMRSDQDALLSFLLCPPAGSDPSADRPIRIIRTLTGEGELAVAEFKDLVLAEPPDPDTGCYQILNSIPARTLGSGIYTFTLQARGLPLGAPLTRQAALSVE
ncbi:MAG TPA: hypothetical protein VFP98_02135, partial [Candidatus Polarisedimenticolia bacterium]|nr:hypothetical protein [Candidatus Polarisedimenticolia bacterium]